MGRVEWCALMLLVAAEVYSAESTAVRGGAARSTAGDRGDPIASASARRSDVSSPRMLDLDWLLAPSTAASFFATQYTHDALHLVARSAAGVRASNTYAPLGFGTGGGGVDDALDLLRRFESLDFPYVKVYRDGGRVLDAELQATESAATLRARLFAGESVVLRLEEALRAARADGVSDRESGALEALQELRAQLEARLVTQVSMHLYLSAPRSDVLKPHTDPYDVFVLQLEGRKRWHICVPRDVEGGGGGAGASSSLGERAARYEIDHTAHAAACTQYTHGDMLRMGDCRSVTLAPGELLYLPKGFVHVAHTLDDDTSTHLTIGVVREGRRWRDVVERMLGDTGDGSQASLTASATVAAALDEVVRSGERRAEWNALVPAHVLACNGPPRAGALSGPLPCLNFSNPDAVHALSARWSALYDDLGQRAVARLPIKYRD